MERVAFLIEETGLCIRCLLNPESLIVQRCSGVKTRQTVGGAVSGSEFNDEQLLYTGGGYTQFTLDLLFDVSLAGSLTKSGDVRELTSPIWQLSENIQHEKSNSRPYFCRFIWGKSWNIPGIVVAVAEKFDLFSNNGVPQRSWLRMRMRRLTEQSTQNSVAISRSSTKKTNPPLSRRSDIVDQEITAEEVSGERLDQLAYKYYGDCNLMHELADYNNLTDLSNIPEGYVINIPPLSSLLAGVSP